MKNTNTLKINQPVIFVGVIFFGVLVYLLAPVLMPFMVAALFAYLGDPLVDRLETYKLSRSVAVAIVFLIILLGLILVPLVMLPLIEQQISALITKLPQYMQTLQSKILPFLNSWLGVEQSAIDVAMIKQTISKHWNQFGGFAAYILRGLADSGLVVVAWLANIVLIPVVTFYLLRDWDVLIEKIHSLLPRSKEPTIVKLARESDEVLGAFLRGQLLVMACLGFVYSIGLWMVGLDFALLIGMVAGLVSFVPYLGFIVGIIAAFIAAAMQFGEVMSFVYVAIVFGVGQLLEGVLLTPLLVGDKIGLHPVAVIFAVMAGGQLFGFVGILIALPVAAVVMVLLRHMHELYTRSGMYADEETPDMDNDKAQ